MNTCITPIAKDCSVYDFTAELGLFVAVREVDITAETAQRLVGNHGENKWVPAHPAVQTKSGASFLIESAFMVNEDGRFFEAKLLKRYDFVCSATEDAKKLCELLNR